MKKLILLITCLFSIISISAQTYSGGTGTETDPYLISSKTDMEALAAAVNATSGRNAYAGKYFLLTQDITEVTTVIGNFSTRYFSGVFDGGGHDLSLTMNVRFSTRDVYAGVFGVIRNATIKNLTVSGQVSAAVYYTGGVYDAYSSGICANALNSSIFNCRNNATISTSIISVSDGTSAYAYSGGICGYASSCIISNCDNIGDISSSAGNSNGIKWSRLGGICGSALDNTSIAYCSNVGDISLPGHYITVSYMGGICGIIRGTISDSYNIGNILTNFNVSGFTGGICASTDGFINNCYTIGSISCTTGNSSSAGGILGLREGEGEINNCFAANTTLTGRTSSTARIVGNETNITNCHALSSMTVNGSIVSSSDATNKNGKDEVFSNFQSQSWINANLPTWDFVNTWSMSDINSINQGLPVLKTQLQYTITASAGANGTISPNGATTVNYGGSQAYTITPSTGYEIDEVLVDGSAVAAGDYTFSNVTANHTISVTFKQLQYTITSSAGANGTITPNGATTVNYNGSQAYTITPSTGYEIDEVLVDGSAVAAGDYTFSNVIANHTISVSFKQLQYTITSSAGANGTISPSGTTTVNYNGSQAYTITPSTGYEIDEVLVDGSTVAAGDYTFSNVTDNHTISVTFKQLQYTITSSAGANGTISPSGTTAVNYNGSQAYTITPSTGYEIDEVLVDGSAVAAGDYTFSNVIANHTISVSFKQLQYTITSSAGANGTISPNGTTTVNYNGSQAYTITPSTGYEIDEVLVDGSAVAAGDYTFSNVTANHTISVTFKQLQHTITSSAGANGTISPNGTTTVNYDGSQAYTITPSTGYEIDEVLVDGSAVAAGDNTFSNVTANHTISVTFKQLQYTITSSAGANGTISPNGATTVNYNGSQAYTITPSTGYEIDEVLVDGSAVAAGDYTFSNVTANHTISVTFKQLQYTITSSAGANGTISPSGTTTVNYNGSQAYTITPSTGYEIDEVLVDGSAVTAGDYTFSNVIANHTISVSFKQLQYTITSSAGANGTISPNGATTVNYNGSQVYTITPSTGYEIDEVLVDGSAVTAGDYTFSNVTANHTISVSFKQLQYTITSSAGANGTISPNGTTTISYGGNQAYTITPSTGYEIDEVLVDGTAVTAGDYTFSNVTANHTISVTFKQLQYTITSSAGSNGTISPSGTTTVSYGGSQAYTITPSTGYEIDEVLVDGTAVAAEDYTFSNVTGNHTISVTFNQLQYTITSSAGANGTISPSGETTVNYGSSQAYSITPSTGYEIDEVLVDGSAVTAGDYTFSNVTTNHTISVTFKQLQYTITSSAGSNGTISPSGTTTVSYGGSQAYTITPSTGYEIDEVLIDGTAVAAEDYTFSNVTGNHTISVTFKQLQYTITSSAGANGTISPSGETTVNYGSSQAYTITPSTGYEIDEVLVDGSAVTAGDYTFSNVTTNHTISVTFKQLQYTITSSVGANGSITPSGATTVNYGGNQAYTITPSTGYKIDEVLVDGSAVTAEDYTFSNVTVNHTISVTFKQLQYTITSSAGANGSITPSGTTTVNYGGSQAYAITPSTGYEIDEVLVDGLAVTAGDNTFSNVTANHTISVTFKQLQYTITSSTGINGTISPNGATTVNYGDNQAYTITPSTGYEIDEVLVDGTAVAAGNYTFSNVTGNHTISVTFKQLQYTITASAGINGTISPNGTTTVNYNGSQAYTISPSTGYEIDEVLVDGSAVAAEDYTFSNVTANHTISVTFKQLQYTITSSAGINGTISPNGATTVNYGDNQAYTITPSTGYEIDEVLVDGTAVAAGNYTFSNVTGNHTISVAFKQLQYTITSSAGANGSITPSGATTVNYSGSQAYSITPSTGYEIDEVLVDGSAVTAGDYTFSNVTANHTISVTFKQLQYTITSSAGSNGTISPIGETTVNYGGNQTYTITPNTGYEIDEVLVNGVSMMVDNYTFSNITSNHTIAVTFKQTVIITNPNLNNIVTEGTISPQFSAEIINYRILMPCNQNTITIDFSTQSPVAIMNIDGEDVGNSASKSFTLTTPGQKTFAVIVNDRGDTKTYNITLVRPFDDVVLPVWNDVLSVINVPQNNGGYTFTNYQWYSDKELTQPMANETKGNLYVPNQSNSDPNYTVWLTALDGTASFGCRKLTNLRSASVRAYPNPTTEIVFVENEENEVISQLELYDTTGKLLMKQTVNSATTQLNLNGLIDGTYLLKVDGQTFKIIKK